MTHNTVKTPLSSIINVKIGS